MIPRESFLRGWVANGFTGELLVQEGGKLFHLIASCPGRWKMVSRESLLSRWVASGFKGELLAPR
jgi:hypothetical protein